MEKAAKQTAGHGDGLPVICIPGVPDADPCVALFHGSVYGHGSRSKTDARLLEVVYSFSLYVCQEC